MEIRDNWSCFSYCVDPRDWTQVILSAITYIIRTEESSFIKSSCCSCRGSRFGSQHLMEAHNYSQLQFWPQWAQGTHKVHLHTRKTPNHVKIFLKKYILEFVISFSFQSQTCFIFFYVWVFCLNIWMHCMCTLPLEARRGHHLLGLELQSAVSCHVGSRTQTWLLWKNSQYS